jgi:recombination protein RecT
MSTTNQQGALAKATSQNKVSTQKKQPQSIKDYIQVMTPEISKALPKVMTPERFTRIALSAVSNTPKLAECTPSSFLGAMMNAAQLGLEPNTPLGQAYLIPYGKTCQFQIGYKGLLDLAHRANTNVEAHEVYENDEFEYSYGLEPTLKHVPSMKTRGKVIAYYAIWRNENNYGFEVMSKEDIDAHAKKFSKTASNGPWVTNYDEMAKKTVIKKVLKYAPLNSEFAMQLTADESVKSEINEDMSLVPNEVYETDTTVFDADTGEVIE